MKISTVQYAKTLLELTDGKSEQEIFVMVKSFAELLKKDGQLKNTGKIMEKFSQLYNTKHQIVEAVVVSRRELDLKMIENVQEFLQKKYGAKSVQIENVVDEKIKGGLIVKVGDEILDGSVNSKLNKLKKVLYS